MEFYRAVISLHSKQYVPFPIISALYILDLFPLSAMLGRRTDKRFCSSTSKVTPNDKGEEKQDIYKRRKD